MNSNFASANDKTLYQRGVNHNLMGMNTNFRNMGIVNTPMNTAELLNTETLNKYNVIKRGELKSELINKPIKVIATFSNVTDSTYFTINFDQPIKDIVSVKLLNGYYTQETAAIASTPRYIAIIIDEIRKNRGYAKTITDVYDNSFGTLDYDSVSQYGSGIGIPTYNFYKNTFATHQDVEYFDPPLHSLHKLTIRLMGGGSAITTGVTHTGKLEFLIETKEKMRVY